MAVNWRTPELSGEMVHLRPIRTDDAEALWMGLNDADTRRMLGLHQEYSLESVQDWCAGVDSREGRYDWAMTLDGEIIRGRVNLTGIDESFFRASLQLFTLPSHRGRGYGREAIMLILRHAFAPRAEGGLGLHRVEAQVLSTDQRAAALYQSLGLMIEGRRREVFADGARYADAIIMGMLDEEFPRAQSTWS